MPAAGHAEDWQTRIINHQRERERERGVNVAGLCRSVTGMRISRPHIGMDQHVRERGRPWRSDYGIRHHDVGVALDVRRRQREPTMAIRYY